MSVPDQRSGRRLFAAEELALRPAPAVRLRELAARPQRAATARERRADEDAQLLASLRRQADDLARIHHLRPFRIDLERDGVVGHYGICYADGQIRIRLRHARTGRPLKESSLVDTLCHELAHLRHLDHSIRFRRLYAKILDSARERGYYRPGPSEHAARPRQLSLFDAGSCGTAPRSGLRRS